MNLNFCCDNSIATSYLESPVKVVGGDLLDREIFSRHTLSPLVTIKSLKCRWNATAYGDILADHLPQFTLHTTSGGNVQYCKLKKKGGEFINERQKWFFRVKVVAASTGSESHRTPIKQHRTHSRGPAANPIREKYVTPGLSKGTVTNSLLSLVGYIAQAILALTSPLYTYLRGGGVRLRVRHRAREQHPQSTHPMVHRPKH